jgi:polyribonucleotide nucleotidyltransferase
MASVCGASLALMDAGISIKGAVAGIAMGLVKEGDDYAILTDIAGAEDHYGDMDFKVAGTREGITALQMDIKIGGITGEIMREAMEQARRGRLFLLDIMDAHLAGAREIKSKHAPQIRTLQIPVDKIRDLIGPGGKVIRGIIEQTGVKIDVEDTGRVNVASSDADGLAKALEIINNITAVPEIGKTYLGKVVRIAEFGAFVELFPGTDGLLHVSEIAEHRVKEVSDELKDGDQVLVKVLGIEGNRIKLSRKALLREQREKLGLPLAQPAEGGRSERAPRPERSESAQPSDNGSTITIEGGDDFDDDFDGPEDGEEGDEPNFNTDAAVGAPAGDRPQGGAAAAGQRRRRGRGRGSKPGGGGGGRGPGQGGARA